MGDSDGAAREYAKLTNGASAPHAHYGLGRDLEARGQHDAALTHLQNAVQLYPEFGAAWYTLGWCSAISAGWRKPRNRCGGHSNTAPCGRRSTIP